MSTLDVDKLIPEPAKEDLKEVVALLGVARDTVIELAKESLKVKFDGTGANTLAGATKLVGGYKDKMDELTLAMNEYQKATNQVAITQARFDAMGSDTGKQLVDNRDKLRQLTNELRSQGDAYKELVLKYQAAAAEALRLGAASKGTSQEYKAAAAYARSLSQELLTLEQSVGRNFRQVGNYNLVGHEFSQLLRELPSFAYSAGTGILSLSNNLPLFFDGIKKALASGESFADIIKRLGLELVTPINLLTLATSALTIFAARMSETSTSASDASNSIDNVTDSIKKLIAEEDKHRIQEEDQGNSGEKAIKRALEIAKAHADGTKTALEEINKLEPKYGQKRHDDLQRQIDDLKQLEQAYYDLQGISGFDEEQQKKIRDNALSRFDEADRIKLVEQFKKAYADVNNASKLPDSFKDEYLKLIEDQKDIDAQTQANITRNRLKENKIRATDLTNEELAVEERVNKARAERRKADLEDDAVHQKNIIDNNTNSLDERLTALNEYIEDKRVINGIDEQRELKDIQDKLSKIEEIEQISDSKRTAAQKKLVLEKPALLEEELTITSKYASKDVALTEERIKEKLGLVKQYTDAEVQYQLDSINKITENNLVNQNAQQQQLVESLSKNEISYRTYQEKTKLLQDQYSKKNSDDIVSYLQEILDTEQLTADQRRKIQEKLDAARVNSAKNANKEIVDNAIATAKAQEDAIRKVSDSIISIYDSESQKKISNIDSQIAAIEDQKNRELSAANLTDEQKRVIEANAAQQEAQLQQQKRQEQLKQAQADKEYALFKIFAETARAVAEALPNVQKAEAVAIEGAAEYAAVAARPLPNSYWDGTPSGGHKGGPAEVAERGLPEFMKLPGNDWQIIENHTIFPNMPKGTEVVPLHKALDHFLTPNLAARGQSDGIDSLISKIANSNQNIISAIQSIPQNTVVFDRFGYMRSVVRRGNSTISRLNKRIFD